jgi:hypothetical protein
MATTLNDAAKKKEAEPQAAVEPVVDGPGRAG